MEEILVKRDKKNGGIIVEGKIGNDMVVKKVNDSVRKKMEK
jgi:hypothetical protein